MWHVLIATISAPTHLNVSKGLILLPLCKATFAVIVLFTIVMKLRELPFQSSKEITSSSGASNATVYARSVEYAAIVVSTLPILLVYPFAQRYFVTGMTIGAVKA